MNTPGDERDFGVAGAQCEGDLNRYQGLVGSGTMSRSIQAALPHLYYTAGSPGHALLRCSSTLTSPDFPTLARYLVRIRHLGCQ